MLEIGSASKAFAFVFATVRTNMETFSVYFIRIYFRVYTISVGAYFGFSHSLAAIRLNWHSTRILSNQDQEWGFWSIFQRLTYPNIDMMDYGYFNDIFNRM